jgi:phosphoribosyl-AMP cyclohydrolase
VTSTGQPPAPPVRFGPDGLIPAVIQDTETRAVLMIGYMNDAALRATRESGRVHFWSRSRQKLWRKGETSGHEQIVDDIYVNCEQNSLLVTVRQLGAVCHDGYDTCFFRRLEPDDTLTVVRERAFDPARVYGKEGASDAGLADRSREHYAAFAHLRDHDLGTTSRTSALLRDPAARYEPRIADELRELAGVLDGTHRHADFTADIELESSQVLYWTTLAALQRRLAWDEWLPDRALATRSAELSTETLAKLLRAEARQWDAGGDTTASRLHATLALVGQALSAGGVTPDELIAADLAELLAKPYMAGYGAE